MTCSLALLHNTPVPWCGLAPCSYRAPMVRSMYMRQPLSKREATIVKRMKAVGRLPVSVIASITERHKKTIYNVLKGEHTLCGARPEAKVAKA